MTPPIRKHPVARSSFIPRDRRFAILVSVVGYGTRRLSAASLCRAEDQKSFAGGLFHISAVVAGRRPYPAGLHTPPDGSQPESNLTNHHRED